MNYHENRDFDDTISSNESSLKTINVFYPKKLTSLAPMS